MAAVELLSAFGFLARAGARILFIPRYCLDQFSSLHSWPQNEYVRKRFGRRCWWRIWLLYDAQGLEEMERLINEGSDEELVRMRDARLDSFRMVAVVGAVLASVALQALNLPEITLTHWSVRGQFTISNMLSMLATFFTCIQQRELGTLRDAQDIRDWLSDLKYTDSSTGLTVYRSSMASLQLLESPYEFLVLAVLTYIGGIAAYLGSAWVKEVGLQADAAGFFSTMVVPVVFAVATAFAFSLFPMLLGIKDREGRRLREGMERGAYVLDATSAVAC